MDGDTTYLLKMYEREGGRERERDRERERGACRQRQIDTSLSAPSPLIRVFAVFFARFADSGRGM